MTKTTKRLLAVSLTAFAIGCTDALWGFGRPMGAVFFGLFMISKILEKEAALFDQEEKLRIALGEGKSASAPIRAQRALEDVYGASQHSAAAH